MTSEPDAHWTEPLARRHRLCSDADAGSHGHVDFQFMLQELGECEVEQVKVMDGMYGSAEEPKLRSHYIRA